LSSGRRDLVVISLAVAGVVGAISLAGIFIVYLVDTIGGEERATLRGRPAARRASPPRPAEARRPAPPAVRTRSI
jgi:hypothetical protein